MWRYIELFLVSVIAPNAILVVYGILFGGIHLVFIPMMWRYIELFLVSVIAPNATMVVYGISSGGMHPVIYI